MQKQENAQTITEQEADIIGLMGKLDAAEQVLMFEVLKVMANGGNVESAFIHQPGQYRQILATMDCGQLFEAIPLMRYIQARGEGWGEIYTLAFAYHAGIADGKRLDRKRRASKKIA